ncbi:nucleoside hydrolase [Tichowtungia aerotolerans]|uniref:Nucleoside hydrolase n=2 Tax=Tichowtungia aerotolerans TaxID=2697043 RepID=A0A6P1MAB0_9BACT|nr:nucleoside hydrolase [Tichowtungia aerotolerans]
MLIPHLGYAAGAASALAESPEKIRVLIDSDANNETDDQHAIAYALFSDDVFDVEGITVNKTRNGGDVREQMKEAVRVVKLCNRYLKVPLYRGANGIFEDILPNIDMPYFDGYEAVNFIIQQAKIKSDRKLVLLPIGKLTNIALALARDPSIIPNVKVVWLGSNYPKPGEYNMMDDLSAVRYLLESSVEFEMVTVRYKDTVNPGGTWVIKAYQEEIFRRMPGLGPHLSQSVTGRHGGEFSCFGDYSKSLFSCARQHGNPPYRSLFDVGAIAVVKNPDWARSTVMPRPALVGNGWEERPDNPMKMIVWDDFDADAILEDFFGTMEKSGSK